MSALRLGITLDVPQDLVDALNRIAAAIEGTGAVLGHLIEFPRAVAEHPAVQEITPAPAAEPATVQQPIPPAGESGHRPRYQTRYRVGWRAPEREARMREAWPAGVPNRELLPQIADLPGEPLPDRPHFLAGWAHDLGLSRPVGFCDPGAAITWTAERDDCLIAERAQGKVQEAIIPALNALPGRPITSVNAVHQRLQKLKAAGRLVPELPVARGKRLYTPEGLEKLRQSGQRLAAERRAAREGAEAPPRFTPLEPVALALPPAPLALPDAPPAPPLAARPAITEALRTRDGAFSVAAMQLRSAPNAVEVDWDTAAAWAERWAPKALDHETHAEKLAAINAARVAHFLDPWKLIRRRGPAEPMPGAHLGAVA